MHRTTIAAYIGHFLQAPNGVAFGEQVDMSAVKCAVVLCDTAWRDAGAAGEASGEEHLAAADYLRLDAMILVAQLNIRTALEVRSPVQAT